MKDMITSMSITSCMGHILAYVQEAVYIWSPSIQQDDEHVHM